LLALCFWVALKKEVGEMCPLRIGRNKKQKKEVGGENVAVSGQRMKKNGENGLRTSRDEF